MIFNFFILSISSLFPNLINIEDILFSVLFIFLKTITIDLLLFLLILGIAIVNIWLNNPIFEKIGKYGEIKPITILSSEYFFKNYLYIF